MDKMKVFQLYLSKMKQVTNHPGTFPIWNWTALPSSPPRASIGQDFTYPTNKLHYPLLLVSVNQTTTGKNPLHNILNLTSEEQNKPYLNNNLLNLFLFFLALLLLFQE
ncbi:hypothetical protein PGT21_012479 [Puccinia graminis f. sp. tritici]|uniref:Uncharacterized protein n=1 Tax=Puccinia graminis f. sp. tritici TaxID=56615 RepID=A0A5B0NBV0_PUCGR|nr:hypothetical protein PGT21_012479 [Puccinia graminis f. sp. tritici]